MKLQELYKAVVHNLPNAAIHSYSSSCCGNDNHKITFIAGP